MIVELASGIDALYFSGKWLFEPVEFLQNLERAREEAEITGVEAPTVVGDAEFRVQPHSLGRHRFRLDHEHGVVGVSPSAKLPSLRFQPRASFLHGVGAKQALEWLNRTGICADSFP